jgi:alpha-L-arabinofuranosidase
MKKRFLILCSVALWTSACLSAPALQIRVDAGKPGFMRFPERCIVEGRDLNNRYRWKNTIGDPADRHLIINRWNTEFKNRATPDYYAQQLFSRNRGDVVLSVRLNAEDGAAEPLRTVFASATRDDKAGEIILKIVNAGTNAISAGMHLDGIARRQRVSGTEEVLTAESLRAENTFESPRRVVPRLTSARWDVPDFDHTFPPCSFTVLRVAVKQ